MYNKVTSVMVRLSKGKSEFPAFKKFDVVEQGVVRDIPRTTLHAWESATLTPELMPNRQVIYDIPMGQCVTEQTATHVLIYNAAGKPVKFFAKRK